MQQNKINTQFITASQPLAPLLSRDSFLCLDGQSMGLYFPWRELYHSRECFSREADDDLCEYLEKKRAFDVPSKKEQVRIVQLYLDNLYPFYPVVDRSIIDMLDKIPKILLNALLLSGIRYDNTIDKSRIRFEAQKLRNRCRHLEMLETNKITLIQSYLLLSADEEGPEGPLLARSYASKACILIMELGIHMFGARMILESSLTAPSNAPSPSSSYKLSYNMSVLSRMFWVAFCADRILSATTSSAVFIRRSDIIIDEPALEIFEPGEHQTQDFEIFNRWCSVATFVERILASEYRPPTTTVVDETLEGDMADWFGNNFPCPHVPEKYERFFVVSSAYCILLYLRCKVDFLTLLDEGGAENYTYDNSSHNLRLANNKMYYISTLSKSVIEALEHEDNIQHIITIHSILHNLVLLHLEIQTRQGVTLSSDLLSGRIALFERYMSLLNNFKDKWWFAAASYYLCKELNKPDPQNAEEKNHDCNTNIDLASIDSAQDLLSIVFDNSFLNAPPNQG